MSTTHDFIIREQDDLLELVFANSPDAVQSAIKKSAPEQLQMQNLQYLMGILLFIEPPQNILLLGVGAGSLVHFLRHHFAHSHITGVELDGALLQQMQQQMCLPHANERLSYVIDDAQAFVAHTRQTFDLIVVDIFDGSQTPAWLCSMDFTRQLQQCLTPNGALAYNLLLNSERGFKQFYGQLRRVFHQQTLCLESKQYANILLYALNFRTDPQSMSELLVAAQQAEQQFQLPFHHILAVIFNINPQGGGVI